MFPGVGYGGSCFPKDVRALAAVAEANGVEPRILRTVDETNNQQKNVLFRKLKAYFNGDLTGKTIAVWGLSFKPRTDDIREAPSLILIRSLLEAGANVQASDPVAVENVRQELGDSITYCQHHYDACDGADALTILTEWNEFRSPDFDYIKLKMNAPVIFDGRNLYDRQQMARRGFYYSGIGLTALPLEQQVSAQ
jgi:UDPglucose 6-dehydrogenase